MAVSIGTWAGLDLEDAMLFRKSRSKEPKPQQKHHYKFDVDDNGLDINGFILHTDKHEGKRHKFRIYLDSNENNRFDKDDQLIGRTGLKQKHAAKGVGNLLDEDEIGQVEVKFKRNRAIGGGGGKVDTKSDASMRSFDADDLERGPLYTLEEMGESIAVIGTTMAIGIGMEFLIF